MAITEPKTVDSILKKKIVALATDFFADKDEIDITKFNLDALMKNGINYKEYVTPGKAMLKRFLMLFPETLTIEEKNINGGTQYYCRLTENTHISIKQMLINLVEQNGGKILLSSIGPELLKEYGVDYKEYSGGKGLLLWLKTEFSDKFEFDDFYCILKGSIREKIICALTKLIESNSGKFLLAHIGPKLLSDYGIDYKEYSRGLTLQAWLRSDYSNEFVIDGYNLLLTKDANPVIKGIQEEITQMHSMAFMSWWINNVKILQKYTGKTRSSEEWSSIVARGFSYALIGETPLFCYEIEETAKLVFNTGIKTVKGNSLFCVLKPNPNNTLGNLQPYAMEGFCCVAEEDNELCNEIKQNVPDILKSDNVLDEKYEELRSDLELLIRYQEKISSIIPELSKRIDEGASLDTDTFISIKAYYDKWIHAKDIIEYLGWDTENETAINISYLVNRLEYTNRKSDVLKKAVDLFVNFANSISEHCDECCLYEMIDIIKSDIELAQKASLEQYTDFKEILFVYIKLMNITEYDSLPAVAESIEFVNSHFKGIITPPIFKLAFQKKAFDSMVTISKSIPADALELLSQLDEIALNDEVNQDDVIVDCDELLNKTLGCLNTDSFVELLLSIRRICTTKIEKAIALGDYDRCRTLLSNNDATMEDFQKTPEELLHIIDEIEENNTSLTLYECGNRLLKTIGNYNRTAEKYFVAGLVSNPTMCSQALMELYISENDTENFYIVWSKYGQKLSLSSENIKFLLYTLCSKDEDILRQYLMKNTYIFYVPEYSNSLIEVLKDFNYVELLDVCERRSAYISSIPAINDFEKQILQMSSNSEANKVIGYVNSFLPLVESYGYTSDECEKILATLSSYESSEEQFTPISRLYDIQGNKNGTVEKLIWNSLYENFNTKNCVVLLSILISTERYIEACELFECYEETLIKDSVAREIYIRALIQTCSPRLYSFAKNNMQDCLNLFKQEVLSNNDFKNLMNQSSTTDSEDIAFLCEKVIYIAKYLDDIVMQSIIILSDDLRDLAINTGKLVDFGLNTEQVENFVSVYKTDSFPRGRDLLSLAERLYLFIGSSEATKEFALIAFECGFDAISLLWKIYSDTNDIDAKLNLLANNPESRKGKEQEYCTLLLQKNEYEKFLLEVQKLDMDNRELIVQTAIAKCHLGKNIFDELAYLENGIKDVSFYSLNQLLCIMVDVQLFSDLENFIVKHFEEMLSEYSASEIESMVTVNGKLSNDELKKLQKAAVSTESHKLAIYIYETFGVGRLKGASKNFIEESLLEYTKYNEEVQKESLKHLRVIYAKNKEVAIKIILSEITNILSANSDNTEICAKIEQTIDGMTLSSNGVLALMNLLKTYNLPITPQICRSIISMCKDNGIEKECLEFFNSTPSFFSLQNDIYVLSLLCGMYKDAISDNSFNENWIDNAIKTCANLINTEYFYDAEYCMYIIQKKLGNNEFAKFNLLALLDKQHEIPVEFLAEIETEAEKMQITKETNIFELFVEMAKSSEMSKIAEYCEYCGNFVNDNKALLEYYNATFSDTTVDSYSAESCEVLLKLLYINPRNGEYWYHCANMPLEEHPGVYAKLLYKASLLNNKESMWKKCIDACERHSQEDLLMDVLIDCATNIPMPFGLQNLRVILAEKVNTNPLYFSPLDNNRLAELISIICGRMEKDPGVRGNHNALRDLSAIAISTNSKEAYLTMMDYADEYIFGENCNLGFAIACRLILSKRLEEAKPIIERLSSIASVKYKNLISKLAAMSVDELSAWSLEKVNTQLLNMILPDGNYPDIHKINDFALSHMSIDKAETGALLICELLDNIPSDYGCYMALFILCKQLPHRIDILHKALCGLVENKPVGNSQSYYTRTRKDFAILLANIDAIIISQQINDQIAAFDGYDFTKTTWEYYQKCEGNIENVSELNEIQEAYVIIENALKNSSSERKETIYNLVFGYVTGNWSEFLNQCWSKQDNMASYLEYYSKFDTGITRSILNVAYSMPESEQEDFIEWIKNNKTTASNKQLGTAISLYKKEYYTKIPRDILEGNILELPFEENSVFEHVFRNTVSQLISKAPTSVHPCAMLVGYLACSNNAMSEFWKHAMVAFEASNDTVANKLFAAMNEINRKEHVYHGYVNNPYKPAEMYESMMRVTGVFAENENIINTVSKSSFNPWSCINMVFALLYTKRANEVSRLKQYFSEEHQCLTDVILTMINRNISDIDKLDAVRSLSDEISKGIVYYMLRYWDSSKRQTVFLSEEDSVKMATDALERIASNHPGFFGPKLQPSHFIWVEPSKINENAYSQLETNVEKTNYEVVDVSTIEEVAEGGKLSFVSMLEPLSSSEMSIDQLWDEHENIHSFGMENYQHRVSLTKKIYQIALGNNTDDKLLYDYAIRYGVDYYYYCMGNKEYSTANSIVIEMVHAFDTSSSMDGARMLKNTICNTALHELLHRGYSTIRSMVEDYIENKQAFIKMRNMLPASTMSVELNDVNCIYAALETIAKCLNETSASHTSAFRKALTKAGNQLNELKSQGYQGWSNIRHSVLQMIRDEINRLDQRAIMSIDIINKSSNRPFGFIYGQIKNMGNEIAENITIQFSYSNGSESNIYELPKLGKGEIAAFEINYSAAPGTERLSYEIMVSYDSKNERYNYVSNDSLTIKEKEFEEFPTGLYLTDRPITEFSLLEDGTIYSEDFFGREDEKKRINAVFSGKGFSNYKNIIIKGIRRAGKTSILNYLLKYANLKCDDAIAVFIDCSGVKGNNAPIQRTLIDSVIRECRMLNVGNVSASEWDAFAQKWVLPTNHDDCNADDLQYFYRELKVLNANKGLMLIIDEFDILIEEVEKNQGVDSTLLPSLRVLLNSPYCQEAIHLVVCGSTKLIRYMDGGTLNQLFQQFGDNIIEIGRLLEKDMETMLTDPYKEHPEVEFTPFALDWIWKFTSGLVWYSKLVASCALNRAHAQERCVVYPSDIVDAVTTVTSNDDYFRSLKESCRPDEIKILDAIQCLTAKATEYVTISELLELLSNDFCQRDIETIVTRLERMQILQRNPFDRYSYRFAVELYWHYFRVSPSNYERCAEIPVIFKEGKIQQNNQFDDDYFDI